MNIVLITSVINEYSKSIFTPVQRLEQLTDLTIPSIRKKIPNSYIVILEGSALSIDDKNILNDNCDELITFNVIGLDKSLGELNLIYKYLTSDSFLRMYSKLDSVVKISGRYYLLDDFNFFEYNDSVIKSIKSSWTDYYVSVTLYYRVVKKDIDYFIDKISKVALNYGIFIDIEHTFYKYNIVPSKYKIDRLGVGGWLAPSGKYIEDGVEIN